MAEQLGASVIISKHDGTNYVTVSMGTGSSLKFNNALADVTVGIDSKYISGINSCEFSFDGIFTDDAQVFEFITDLKAGTAQDLKITFVSGAEIQATFLAASLDLKMAKKDAVSFSCSFKASGAVSVTNIPV